MLRHLITRWLPVVAIAAATAAAALPTTASAVTSARPIVCPAIAYANPNGWPTDQCGKPIPPAGYRTAGLNHAGWVYLNLNYCAPGAFCTKVYDISRPAWRWTGTRWAHATINDGWVYVYPYTGQWRWAWTQRSGWVALSGGRFEIR